MRIRNTAKTGFTRCKATFKLHKQGKLKRDYSKKHFSVSCATSDDTDLLYLHHTSLYGMARNVSIHRGSAWLVITFTLETQNVTKLVRENTHTKTVDTGKGLYSPATAQRYCHCYWMCM
eukprot:315456_1